MPKEREVNPVPVPGTMNPDPVRAGPNDFDVLINVNPTSGELRPRNGWRICRYVRTWTTSGGYSVPSTYRHLAFQECVPMGAHVYNGNNGIDYILTINRKGGALADSVPTVSVRTTTCQVLTGGREPDGRGSPHGTLDGDGTIQGRPLYAAGSSGAVEEKLHRPYVFCNVGQWVYFTNGGHIWRWSHRIAGDPSHGPLGNGIERISEDLQHWVKDYSNSWAYFTSIRGADIIAYHNGHLVLAGFNHSPAVVDQPLDVNGDGQIDTNDMTKGSFVVLEDGKSVIIPPNYVLFSEEGEPHSIPVRYNLHMSAGRKVTGLASFNKKLIVWTEDQMSVMSGPVHYKAVTLISEGIGCSSHRSICQTPDGRIMWLYRDGIYIWDGTSRPARISKSLDRLFRNEPFAGYPTVLDDLDIENLQAPHVVNHNLLHLASAAIVPGEGYYACALTAGSSTEHNNLTVCVSYRTGQCWLYASRPEKLTKKWSTPTTISDISSDACVAAGIHTMIVNRREPNILMCQGFYSFNHWNQAVSNWRYHVAICTMDNEWGDQRLVYGTESAEEDHPIISETKFDFLAITSRIFLGNSGSKRPEEVHLRMWATHNDDWESVVYPGGPAGATGAVDANRLHLVYLPELSAFDNDKQSDTVRKETDSIVNPWPDEYSTPKTIVPGSTELYGQRRYFFQTNSAKSALINKYGNLPADAACIDWLSLQVFDKRVKLRLLGRSTQFLRLALFKVIDNVSGPTPRILSIGMDVKGPLGERS